MGEMVKGSGFYAPAKTRGVWSPEVAEQVLDIVSETGSPQKAADALGMHVKTIHYHRKADVEFGTAYQEAMDTAFHQVLGHAFNRSMDAEKPSDRLTEVLLKFRWPERLSSFLSINEGGERTDGPANLDPRVIARMDPADRTTLVTLLEKYLDAQDAIRSQA